MLDRKGATLPASNARERFADLLAERIGLRRRPGAAENTRSARCYARAWMPDLRVTSAYRPTGDQPRAIAELAASLRDGNRGQTLLGATGTGKTATMAWLIEELQRPALVIAHNKTLAAQLCNEFREFFPGNAVEYFVSVLRLLPARGVRPAGRPLHREGLLAERRHRPPTPRGEHLARDAAGRRRRRLRVVHLRDRLAGGVRGARRPPRRRRGVRPRPAPSEARRHPVRPQRHAAGRGRFRVKGDVVELQPAYLETAYRISFFGDEIEQISHFDPLTGEVLGRLDDLTAFPATQYVTSKPTIERAADEIRHELETQVATFETEGRMLEAHRIRQRTEYDLEMMKELGFCNGIENYSRILDGRPEGSRAVHAARLLPVRLPLPDRRVAPDRAADRRHVRGRPVAEADARRLRLPAPVGARQPAAPVRRVPREGGADGLRLSDARRRTSCGTPRSSPSS